MPKNRVFLKIAAAIFLNFCLNNLSFAIDAKVSENIYPDFAYEFSGKDTCEGFNRKLLVFNLRLNRYVIRPVNVVWSSVMPKCAMDKLQNAYNNMNSPVRILSCALQKDFKSSRQEALRFLTNTTVGLGGLFDPAANKFKIEAHQEDMGQVLAHYNMKTGPYLILPVVRGNVRDLCGKLLDCPLRPTMYVGPFGAAANALFAVNNSTYIQPIVKRIEDSYADPYEIVRQADGIERYIKNLNLDRSDVFKEKTAAQNIINVSKTPQDILNPSLNPDVKLTGYNPQDPLVDSMRTAMFDNQKIYKSAWSDLSVWNRNFNKKLKISSVKINENRPNYRFRYVLQKDKNSPLAILYPSIGEGIMADKSTILAKILFDEGYSVIVQGSSFNWEFIKSMPENYKPGIPSQDARYLRLATAKIIDKIQNEKGYKFDRKILVGCSFGALTGIFAASQEEESALAGENTIGISNYIAINPPIEIFFALRQLDKYCSEWKNDPEGTKFKTALTAEKMVRTYKTIYDKKVEEMPESMPFTNEEAKLLVGFIMKQKLYDVVFAVENGSMGKKSDLYSAVNKMSFRDYARKYLFIDTESPSGSMNYETSLYSLAGFLNKNKKYKIYQTLDDYFVTSEQLIWLKNNSKEKAVFFSNGSHLGFMYRKEFIDRFKKDINPQNASAEDKV